MVQAFHQQLQQQQKKLYHINAETNKKNKQIQQHEADPNSKL